ncbi:MAG TPA: type III-B CRISPR module-associated protein Cmr5 [Chthonomonadaceae bacterium]|nr:type III-B CRISPR module-associated protein Cmr5 [Chthonomonadaceae bacterium]
MKIKSRAQADMALAASRMTEIMSDESKRTWKDDYGRICHNFPVMVLTCGLCQAVAFSEAKGVDDGKGDKRKREAHNRILDDVKAITGADARAIAICDAPEYIQHTRRVLAAWSYYKRFAVSILKVKEGGGDER